MHARHRPLAARTQLIVARAFVDDGRVSESDPGHVPGVDDDREVALGRNDRTPDMFGPELSGGNERVLFRPDVVITIGPILDSLPPIETRFRGQRSPADVILVGPP